jgi:molybdenum cofactor guanylyltransferase
MTVVGIFVGGASSRMGGRPKGLLPTANGETVLERTIRIAQTVSPQIVLVGRSDAYRTSVLTLSDPVGTSGPLGGLCSLLEYSGDDRAVALACDMPFITPDLLRRLAIAPSTARAVLPKREGLWEPFFARFDAKRALPFVRSRLASRSGALQGLFDDLEADELPLGPTEARLLSDWDSPEDMR